MADDEDKNRKRRKLDKKNSNDDGVIDLTCKSKVSSFKIHDVVDLTSVAPKPLAPKPVQSSQKSMSNFQPKTMGDCEIVASKNDKLFEDDIVIVVSDAYREKKREERRKKKEAAAVSSRSDQNLPSTSSASGSTSAPTATQPATSGRPVPVFYPDPSSTPAPASTPAIVSTSAPASTSARTSNTAPSTAPLSNPSTSRNLGLTVSTVLTAVTGALATLTSPLTSSTGTSTSSNSSSSVVTAAVNNNILNSEDELWIRFRPYDRRKEYMCPCGHCRGRSWFLTFETVRRHCFRDGFITGWVPANSSSASTSPLGISAIAAGGQANTPGVRPPPAPARPTAPPPARPVPLGGAQPLNTGPVITDNRPNRAGNQQRGIQMNRYQAPLQAPRPAPYQAHLPRGPTHAPAARPPAPTGPSLDNLPKTVPNVVETDPNPLTCPVCLDSKAQIQASSRNLVSTKCGHVFCSFCIEQVFKSTRQCPQCRKKLTNKCWHPLYI